MGVDSKKKRAVDLVLLPVETDRLRNRQDVPLIEGLGERGTAMSRRSEDDTLVGECLGSGRSS
jgi:hypothetical protein